MPGRGIRRLKAQSRALAGELDLHGGRLGHEVRALERATHRALTSPQAFVVAFVAGLTTGTVSPPPRQGTPAQPRDDDTGGRWQPALRRALRLASIWLLRGAAQHVTGR